MQSKLCQCHKQYILHTILRQKDIAIKNIFKQQASMIITIQILVSIDICGTDLYKNKYFQFTLWKQILVEKYLFISISFYCNSMCKNITCDAGLKVM